MAKIKCEQHDCKYNNKNFCIKEGIYVREDAFCESYRKGYLDKRYAFEIASFENDEKGITCQAKECRHNKNCICKARCVYITKQNSFCKTYEYK